MCEGSDGVSLSLSSVCVHDLCHVWTGVQSVCELLSNRFFPADQSAYESCAFVRFCNMNGGT